ncbi:6-phosphogluconolactonase [Onthophagus taurus]|uniref:6-phosphogluconolactonase n=1 Tax=Onthophagus taurus TaxID=166361 RepID=UPI0039BE4921
MNNILVGDNDQQLSAHLSHLLEETSKKAIQERNIFTIGVSGGSAIKFLTDAIILLGDNDLTKWKFFFCDERVVPVSSEDSNFGAYKTELIAKTNLKEDQFVRIKEGVEADEAAVDYVQQMEQYFPTGKFPEFDFLMLGMGPDGHTCSLFPGHKLLEEDKLWVASIVDSPKHPPKRITLTLPVLNNARNCCFVIKGMDKADMAQKVFVDKDQNLPAARVQPNSGMLHLIIQNGLLN